MNRRSTRLSALCLVVGIAGWLVVRATLLAQSDDAKQTTSNVRVPTQPSVEQGVGLVRVAPDLRPTDISELEMEHGRDDKCQPGNHAVNPRSIPLAKQQSTDRGRINDGDHHGRGG